MFKGNNLPHELLLTPRQKIKLRNAFENNMSTDIKLSKTQISKIIQYRGFFGSLLSKIRITAADSAIDAGIRKKMHTSGATTLIISNEEMNDILKIVEALEDSDILLKKINKTIENAAKNKKEGF